MMFNDKTATYLNLYGIFSNFIDIFKTKTTQTDHSNIKYVKVPNQTKFKRASYKSKGNVKQLNQRFKSSSELERKFQEQQIKRMMVKNLKFCDAIAKALIHNLSIIYQATKYDINYKAKNVAIKGHLWTSAVPTIYKLKRRRKKLIKRWRNKLAKNIKTKPGEKGLLEKKSKHFMSNNKTHKNNLRRVLGANYLMRYDIRQDIQAIQYFWTSVHRIKTSNSISIKTFGHFHKLFRISIRIYLMVLTTVYLRRSNHSEALELRYAKQKWGEFIRMANSIRGASKKLINAGQRTKYEQTLMLTFNDTLIEIEGALCNVAKRVSTPSNVKLVKYVFKHVRLMITYPLLKKYFI